MKDKIPFYEIVNMFFVGAVFCLLCCLLMSEYIDYDELSSLSALLKDWSILVGAVLLIAMYEVGFILNRLGSICVGSLLSKIKIWPQGNYTIDVSAIDENNEKFRKMNIELVLTRTHIIMYFLLAIVAALIDKWSLTVVAILLVAIFILSGRKLNAKMNIIKDSYQCNKVEVRK